jgi:hypothetical protein
VIEGVDESLLSAYSVSMDHLGSSRDPFGRCTAWWKP